MSDNTARCVCPVCRDNVYTPICGTDGMTYANLCWMKLAGCKAKKDIGVLKKEACGKFYF